MEAAAPTGRASVVVIGASAGGVEALTRLVERLPGDYPLPLLVVLHVPPTPSMLPEILTRAGRLRAVHARDGESLDASHIYIAPPDCHLLVQDGAARVVRGPKENGHRPAVDPLFRTAAAERGDGVVGIILSGTLDDGTAGLAAVKERGGRTIVQDPKEAVYPPMPMNALTIGPDHVLTVEGIAALLVRLGNSPSEPDPAKSESEDDMEPDPTQQEPTAITEANTQLGRLTAFTCPECSGSLWELQEGNLVKLRCRVGHAYTEDGYAAAKDVNLEAAIWTGLTALVERADFSERLAARFRRNGHELTAKRYEEQAANMREQAETLREALMRLELGARPEEAAS